MEAELASLLRPALADHGQQAILKVIAPPNRRGGKGRQGGERNYLKGSLPEHGNSGDTGHGLFVGPLAARHGSRAIVPQHRGEKSRQITRAT